MMARLRRLLLVLTVAAASVLLTPSPASAHTTYCGHGAHWGWNPLHRVEFTRQWTEYVWSPPRHVHVVYLWPQLHTQRNLCGLH